MTDKKNCLNTITVNRKCLPKNSTYYKDKATQIAALRVTNNSHFRDASSLKSFCYTFKFPLKATRQQRTFLHTTQYIFKPSVSRTTDLDPQFTLVLLRCASATNFMSRKQKGSKCKHFANDWHHNNCLGTFFNENKARDSWGSSIPKSINRTSKNWNFLQMIETKKIDARL